jgi:hypothetical protein
MNPPGTGRTEEIKMKILLLKLILLSQISLVMAPAALAAIGPRTSSLPQFSHPLLGRAFCVVTDRPFKAGWYFSPLGKAIFFTSNLGAPNPFLTTGIVFLDDVHFVLATHDSRTGKPVGSTIIYTYDQTVDTIHAGSTTFSPNSCQR